LRNLSAFSKLENKNWKLQIVSAKREDGWVLEKKI
jgi:hypothetical protein